MFCSWSEDREFKSHHGQIVFLSDSSGYNRRMHSVIDQYFWPLCLFYVTVSNVVCDTYTINSLITFLRLSVL